MPRKKIRLRAGKAGASLRLRPAARDPQPWTVTYLNWGSKREIVRRFSAERRARAFYKSLWQRRMPPVEQGIRGPSGK